MKVPTINKLSKHMANLISAGEVVDRPASAVKELVENAVDAGATRVTIEIANGGIRLIRVTDDGCGIEPDQMQLAFMRYATSKIAAEEDLFGIQTMGFRGEALASIAAVSNAKMISSTDGVTGHVVEVEGGILLSDDDCGCPKGTTVRVNNLFFNTPARHKFLKKDTAEAAAVQTVCTKAAIAHPEISFKFIRDGENIFSTPGNGDLFSALRCLWGRELTDGLIKVDYRIDDYRVEGYVSAPNAARKSRTMQYYFVNTRPVKNLMLQTAVEESFRQSIVSGKYPAAFLNIEVPFTAVDVNVHPAKTEIKFSSEKSVFDLIYYGIKNAVNPVEKSPEEPVAEQEPINESKEQPIPVVITPTIEPNPVKQIIQPATPLVSYRVYEKTPIPIRVAEDTQPVQSSLHDADAFVKNADVAVEKPNIINKNVNKSTENCDTISLVQNKPSFRVIGEIFSVYIVVEQGDELLLIDKHAAHERIRYNRLRLAGNVVKQDYLTPVVVPVDPDEKELLLANVETVRSFGFDITDFGSNTLRLHGVPEEYLSAKPEDAIADMLSVLKDKKSTVTEQKDRMYKMIACRSAIKSGDKSEPAELRYLVECVLNSDDVKTCPHGRPVVVKYTKTEIEKMFSRIV